MKGKLAAALAGLVALAVPASSLGGGDDSQHRANARGGGNGQLVAKDSARQHPEAAAARAELSDFGTVSYVISTKPEHLPVEWAYMVRCEKGFLFDYFPGPGDLETRTKKATISGTYSIPLADPDSCDFQVAGQIGGETDRRGRVIVKIYDK